jgi:hypothetical protein
VPGDAKDWTWVLNTPCPECGFDASRLSRARFGPALRATGQRWADILTGGGAGLAVRPDPQVWSPLEYACHVRDVYRLFDWRLRRMLDEDGPHFENWDQDVTAVQSRYDRADPATVRTELLEALDVLATRFDGVAGEQWERTGFRSDGATFTVDSFGRYLVHDPLHHLHDVGAALP